MFVKKRKYKGRIYLSYVESYRDPKTKTSKHKTIEKIGYLDEQPHPLEYYEAEAARRTKENKQEELIVKLDPNETMSPGFNAVKNFGYASLSSIYHKLNIDYFWNYQKQQRHIAYNPNNIFKLLVFMRLISPGSKRSAYLNRDYFFENTNFTLDDVYHALDFFASNTEKIINFINDNIVDLYGRNTDVTYYDVTSYYFEISNQDEFRRKGFSKENKPDPIIQMGLLIDGDGIPITFKLYPGNTNDCLTYRPFITKVKKELGFERTIIVADKAMNTGDNIAYSIAQGNGYIFSQSVRGATKDIKKYVLDETGYTHYEGGKRKSRLEPRTIYVSKRNIKGEKTGQKSRVNIDQKQVVFYSEKYANKAKKDREEVIKKATEMINSPSKYKQSENYGAVGFIKNLKIDTTTGEILTPHEELQLDIEKIKEAEKYDGYYIISTSELQMSDEDIIQKYHDLWRIEESFKLTKSELKARPICLSKKAHITAHFLTCFVALLILRILEKELNYQYSPNQILNDLRSCTVVNIAKNIFQSTTYSPLLNSLGKTLNIPFERRNFELQEIKKILGDTKK